MRDEWNNPVSQCMFAIPDHWWQQRTLTLVAALNTWPQQSTASSLCNAQAR
jgi:hypothetical protein